MKGYNSSLTGSSHKRTSKLSNKVPKLGVIHLLCFKCTLWTLNIAAGGFHLLVLFHWSEWNCTNNSICVSVFVHFCLYLSSFIVLLSSVAMKYVDIIIQIIRYTIKKHLKVHINSSSIFFRPWRKNSLYPFIIFRLSLVHFFFFFSSSITMGRFPAIHSVPFLSLSDFCKYQAKPWPGSFLCEQKEWSEMSGQGRNRQDHDPTCRISLF